MIETDAPYLTPHPHRGKRNEPGYVVLVAEKLAGLTGATVAEVAERTSRTALAFFGLQERTQIESIETQITADFDMGSS